MTALRRHLASLGLLVASCQLVIQILVPAALCCERFEAAPKAAAKDCCPVGSHSGGICPMHGNRARAASQDDCQARPLIDLHDIFTSLTVGGVLTAFVPLPEPAGAEAALIAAQPSAALVFSVPPGPPPRV